MLDHETVNKLRYMKLTGIAEALKEQNDDDAYQDMGFRDRFALLVDREFCKRQHGRLQRLINGAKFENPTACVEDIRYDDDRKLDRSFILELASCSYVRHARNVVIVGPTGAGKSFLAQALGQAACRRFLKTRYIQLPDLLDEDTQLLLSLVDRRHNHQATIIASQFEPAEWLDQIPVPVAAEAITDRLCSQAYRIVIKGKKSMREAARD